MAAARLARTIRRLHGAAAGELRYQSRVLREGRDPKVTVEEWAFFRAQDARIADENLDVMGVCEAVLSAMGAKPPRWRSKALSA